MRNALGILAITAFCSCLTTSASSADGKPVTASGWFADKACAEARAKSGTFTSTNPECALRCMKKGEKLVFIAEHQKAIWLVDQPASYIEHIGEYVEIKGSLNESALQIESLKTIEKVRPSCGIGAHHAQGH
jgi:hypothetical protein